MDEDQLRFRTVAAKTIVGHTVTYVFMGALASHFLDYAAAYAQPSSGMRPFTSPWVLAGPLFQPLRALIFASVFYPLRRCIFGTKSGWLLMAWMLIALGILSTFGPAPGSIEGMIYTQVPILLQMKGWLEIVPQALLLSGVLYYWIGHPENKWLSWVLGAVFTGFMALMAFSLALRLR